MKKILVAIIFLLFALPAHAVDVYISDQGGTHVGSCADNLIYSPSFADGYNLNYGATVALGIGQEGVLNGYQHVLQRYDISAIPDQATIQSAEIVMVCSSISGTGAGDISVYEIHANNNNWVEGTQNGAVEAGSSCWNDHTYQNSQEWAGGAGCDLSGTDYYATALATTSVTTTGTKTWTFNATGVADIKDRLDDDDIEVIFIDAAFSAGNFSTFHSSEAAVTGNRPYLKVTYTLPQPIIIRR